MVAILKQRHIEELVLECAAQLGELAAGEKADVQHRLNLDPGPLMIALAWQSVVSVLIVFVSNVTFTKSAAEDLKKKSIDELRVDALKHLGSRIDLKDRSRMEEAVIFVEELLRPLSVDRSQARAVVEMLQSGLSGSSGPSIIRRGSKDKLALSIFISYAREDRIAARGIYDFLRSQGFAAWIDDEDLAPGARWKLEISEQIKKSDFFIAVLSAQSVSKRGYVQKELRLAFEVLSELPESNIFLVPVRLNDCRPSQPILTDLHWLDLFPSQERGLERLVDFLRSTSRESYQSRSSEGLD